MPFNTRQATDERKILDGVTLTAAYSGNTSAAHECRSVGSFTIIPVYAAHASSPSANAELQIEFSPDGTNYSPTGTWNDGGSGEMSYTAETYNIDQTNKYPQIVLNALGRWMRIKVREQGHVASNFGTISVYVYSSNV